MSVTLPNMGIILPTLGADRNTWDDKLNAGLTKVDSHNHTAGNGVQVPSAGININADLPFGGFGPTALGKAAFSAVTALTTGARTLFVNTADGELYWRTNAGVNVKLTSGSSLNISLVGGIAGDYTTAGAELYYDEASKTYRFTSAGTPKLWARVEAGAFRVAKFGTSAAFYASIEVDNAIAANYTLTLPAAVAVGIMQVSGAGVVSFSFTLPNNQNLALQGTGKLVHGDQTMTTPFNLGVITGQTGTVGGITGAGAIGVSATANSIGYLLLRTPEAGKRIKSLLVTCDALGFNNHLFRLYVNASGSWIQISGNINPAVSATIATIPTTGLYAAGYEIQNGDFFALFITASPSEALTVHKGTITFDSV